MTGAAYLEFDRKRAAVLERSVALFDILNPPKSRPRPQLLLERGQLPGIADRVDFHRPIETVLDVSGEAEPLGAIFDKIAKPHALHPATNDVSPSVPRRLIGAFQNQEIPTRS